MDKKFLAKILTARMILTAAPAKPGIEADAKDWQPDRGI